MSARVSPTPRRVQLSFGSLNFTSVPARAQRAKILREKARTGTKIDFTNCLKRYACGLKTRNARDRSPSSSRCSAARSGANAGRLGLRFLVNHLSIVFGMGDTANSCRVVRRGIFANQGARVLYVDWELDSEDIATAWKRFAGRRTCQRASAISSKQYDKMFAAAQRDRVSVAEWMRAKYAGPTAIDATTAERNRWGGRGRATRNRPCYLNGLSQLDLTPVRVREMGAGR